MPILKYHPADRFGERDSYPFPGRSARPLPRPSFALRGIDAATHAEAALDQAQRRLDRLKNLISMSGDDDRPRAA